MIELLRTNDPVFISWLRAILAEQNIEAVILDTHTSVLEGSALAIPRRVMILDEDYDRAIQVYEQARNDVDPSLPAPNER